MTLILKMTCPLTKLERSTLKLILKPISPRRNCRNSKLKLKNYAPFRRWCSREKLKLYLHGMRRQCDSDPYCISDFEWSNNNDLLGFRLQLYAKFPRFPPYLFLVSFNFRQKLEGTRTDKFMHLLLWNPFRRLIDLYYLVFIWFFVDMVPYLDQSLPQFHYFFSIFLKYALSCKYLFTFLYKLFSCEKGNNRSFAVMKLKCFFKDSPSFQLLWLVE